ncbi:MAG: apolipoprotein N-acyltransferase, partial [Spirochaetia bacterium]|nr:apolipoprotein N-acyltransferase [Spirochaetia bacterium]
MKYILDLNRWQVMLLGAVSGVLLALAHPTLDWFPLAFVALVPLFIIYFTQGYGKVLLGTLFFAIFFFGIYLNWVTYFSWMAVPGILFLLLVLFYIPASLAARFLSGRYPFLFSIIIPLVFTGMEYFRTIGFLRFPYGILGYSQYKFLPFIQIADITGVLGVSFVLYLVNALLAEFAVVYFFAHNRKNFINRTRDFFLNRFALILGILIALNAYGIYRLYFSKYEEGPVAKVSLVQNWFDFNQAWTEDTKQQVFNDLTGYARNVKKDKPDLVVWPETAILEPYEYYVAAAMPYSRQFQNFFGGYNLDGGQTHFLTGALAVRFVEGPKKESFFKRKNKSAKGQKTGAVTTERRIKEYNSALHLSPSGVVQDRYSKHFLVAFAEWFPYGDLFPWLDKLLKSLQASEFAPGETMTIFKHPKFKFSTLICYEDCFAGICRDFVLGGSEVFFVLTNDAWSYSQKSQT